jgi:hypothetical protein
MYTIFCRKNNENFRENWKKSFLENALATKDWGECEFRHVRLFACLSIINYLIKNFLDFRIVLFVLMWGFFLVIFGLGKRSFNEY